MALAGFQTVSALQHEGPAVGGAPVGAPVVQAVRAAIIADAADGSLSGNGMMAKLPTDQRLQGPMQSCVSNLRGEQVTSPLSWYASTPACVHQRTLQAEASTVRSQSAEPAGAVRGLW